MQNSYGDDIGDVFTLIDNTLTIYNPNVCGQIQINDFHNGDLGINLIEKQKVETTIDSRSGPWSVSVNPAYEYATPYEILGGATTVGRSPNLLLNAGDHLVINYLWGAVSFSGASHWDANGEIGLDGSGYLCPGHYVSNSPVWTMELIGTFTDSSGVIVGSPFAVGNHIDVIIPEGADELSLGFNDGWFMDNDGTIAVEITENLTDEFYGGDGDDTINAGDNSSDIRDDGGTNHITAGNGNNTIGLYNNTNSYVSVGNGNNSISVVGDAFNCYNTIIVGNGNDTISIQDSYNTIITGDGNNVIDIILGNTNAINTGGGNDIVTVHDNSNTINTGSGNDLINITLGSNNIINAGDGNDTIFGNTETNTMIGSIGNDTYYANNSDDIITENPEEGIYFDEDKSGFAELSGWVDDNDGILVRDINNDGIINNGGELFGDQTVLNNGQLAANGFAALADLDINSDGVIDFNDTAFSELKVLKGDGTLITLEEAGIASLNLDYTNTNITDSSGNAQIQAGSYTKTDGTILSMGDYALQADPVNTVETEWLDVSADIVALPDARGYGNVASLHQAMVRDTSGTLESLVQAYVNEADPAVRKGILDQKSAIAA